MKEFVGFKIEKEIKRNWEERAMETGLNLSDFIRQTMEGELSKDTVSREDIDYLEQRIRLLETNLTKKMSSLNSNVHAAFKEFGTLLGREVGDTIYEVKTGKKRPRGNRKISLNMKENNKEGKWTKIEMPNHREVVNSDNPEEFIRVGDGLVLKRAGKIVNALVKEFDGVEIKLIDKDTKEEFKMPYSMDIKFNERVVSLWRKI